MAWFTYNCDTHGIHRQSQQKRERFILCPVCGGKCFPVLKAGTTQNVEIKDNGAMVRAVERLENIDQIMEERSESHKRRMNNDKSD